MADLLIPDVPDEVVVVLHRIAGRLGISLDEYLHRWLAEEATSGSANSLDHTGNSGQNSDL